MILTRAAFSLAVAIGTVALAAPASASIARCVIRSPAGSSSGPCSYTVRKGGSFTLQPVRQRYLVGNIMIVRVTMLRPGVASVSAESGYGTRSYWGNAWRSSRDGACWNNRTTSVCAY